MKYSKLSKYKYRLEEEFVTEASKELPAVKTYWASVVHGKLRIREGYCWDGASGPTLDTENSMIASLIHDCLYQFIKLGLLDKKYRKIIDVTFKRQLIASGMSKVRANAWYRSVRLFGGIWLKGGKKTVIHEVS